MTAGSTFYFGANDPNRARTLANLTAFIARLPAEKPWAVRVERHVKTRTNQQNRALFGVAYPLLREATGSTLDELHEVMCERVFGAVEYDVLGQRKTRPFRTTTRDENGKHNVVSTEVFQAFYAECQRVGQGLGVYIPDPEPIIPEYAK